MDETIKWPRVTLICVNSSKEYKDNMSDFFDYPDLEIKSLTIQEKDTEQNVYQLLENIESEFICFTQEHFVKEHCIQQKYKIKNQVQYLIENPDVGGVIAKFQFINGSELSDEQKEMSDLFLTSVYGEAHMGAALVYTSIMLKYNILGSLQGGCFRRADLLQKERLLTDYPLAEGSFLLYYELLFGLRIGCMDSILYSIREKELDVEELGRKEGAYRKFIHYLASEKFAGLEIPKEHMPPVFEQLVHPGKLQPSRAENIKKEITFFYSDIGEYHNLDPIRLEAARRGYEVKFTDQLTESAEIGFYCQHSCMPENAKFSVILLHDLAQGHNRWPDLWNIERWDKFDLGILPGKEWEERWKCCSGRTYVHPRKGAYIAGYPKSDQRMSEAVEKKAAKLREEMKMPHSYTILYAPSWEYDRKEEDFVLALQSLNVNLLIKQAHWNPSYSAIIENIREMRNAHEKQYDNVFYIEPEESISTAITMCDLLVSDESSVMVEALLMGKPSIAVMDWLIPDQNPPRKAIFPFEFAVKCKRVQLREQVGLMMQKTDHKEVDEQKERLFTNIGKSSESIMDLVDYWTQGKEAGEALKLEAVPRFMPNLTWID